MPSRSRFGISGSTLKIIAIISMLIDHTTDILLDQQQHPQLFFILRGLIGRIAFPIFCFLLVEGFIYTRNTVKYAVRLGIFALVSEIPFDLAFSHVLFNPGYQNVFFTLLIGLLAVMALKKWEHKPLIMGLSLLISCGAAIMLKTDYGYMGVLLIVLFYEFRGHKLETAVVNGLFNYVKGQIGGILSIPFIALYNGTRGLALKYIFYAFYPVHLLLLHWISTM